MLPAAFSAVRGKFRFGPNNHPIQDWWSLSVEKGPDGKLFLKTQEKILSDRGDVYAAQCKL
jgi:branched-chain amino acid transport system substrate-binding protein